MCLWVRVSAKLLASCLLVSCWEAALGQTATPANAGASGSPYKVLRSVSGAAGHEANGRYVMDDPRSVFTAAKDAKVTVYFEWEGPLGPHHFEGLWKSPEGRIVLISDFRYEAKAPRYSGYWSMLLTDTTPSGEWSMEARIDGEPAGTHSFVITGSPTASAPAAGPRLLSSADLYQKAMDASVSIAKIGADGVVLDKGSGFWVGDGRILTAFNVIDGASSLRVSLKDGSQLTTDQAIAWNRWQDWALLKLEGTAKPWLKRAADQPKVGDRCVLLEVGPVGARLADGSITGKNAFPRAGERLLVASGITSASFGGPLLDEYGNYVGILGGSILPGGDPIKTLSLLSEPGAVGQPKDWETTGLAVPSNLLPDFNLAGSTTRLAELANRGEFLPPVMKSNSMQFVTLASAVSKDRGGLPSPRDYKRVFSRRDKEAVAYVNWQAQSKEKFSCILRLFDADNKLVSESKSRELSLAPGKYMSTTWDISVGSMFPGIYRVDLVLDGKTAWRDFFRVTD